MKICMYTKFYDVKYGYAQIGHDIAIHNYIMQSYSQLCAIDAKQFYNSGRIMQIYAQLWPSITIS